jgi:hypothetical protein
VSKGYEVFGFMDDIVIMVMLDLSLSERMQKGLNYASRINLNKTLEIPFTRRRKHSLKNPVMKGVTIECSRDRKNLGVVSADKLLWNSQMKRVRDRAIKALIACIYVIGLRWFLRPAMLRWIDTMVVRPLMTYASIVWWNVDAAELQNLERLAYLRTTGVMKSAAPSLG